MLKCQELVDLRLCWVPFKISFFLVFNVCSSFEVVFHSLGPKFRVVFPMYMVFPHLRV